MAVTAFVAHSREHSFRRPSIPMNLEDLYRLLRAGHVQAQGIVDTLEQPLLVLDQHLSVESGNVAFFRTFCVSKDETVGQPVFDLGDGQWDIPELRKLLSDVVPRSTAVIGYEVRHLSLIHI